MKYEDWKDRWEELISKYTLKGYESFDSNERIWFNIRSLIETVDNGGVISFYYNYGADYMDETLEDLGKIGDREVIQILERVNQLFPNGKPSKDIDERNEVIDTFEEDDSLEELFESLDEEFYSLEEELEAKLDTIVIKVLNR